MNERLTILSAEDDSDDQLLLKEAVAEIHFPTQLRFFRNGDELLQYLAKSCCINRPDTEAIGCMVLLDLNMPVMDGRETLRRIKNDPRFKDIPVVVFTTSSLKEDRKECKRLGADAFISKPSSFQGMVNAIQEVVAKWFPAL